MGFQGWESQQRSILETGMMMTMTTTKVMKASIMNPGDPQQIGTFYVFPRTLRILLMIEVIVMIQRVMMNVDLEGWIKIHWSYLCSYLHLRLLALQSISQEGDNGERG